jgi:hypothetical protein
MKQCHEIRHLVVVVDHVHRQQAAAVSNLREIFAHAPAHSSAHRRVEPPTGLCQYNH